MNHFAVSGVRKNTIINEGKVDLRKGNSSKLDTKVNQSRKPKQVMEARREKRRGRGRPRNTWEDCVIDVARREGKTFAELKRLARERFAFRKWTEDPTLQGNRDR